MALSTELQVNRVSFRFQSVAMFTEWSTTLGAGINWLRGPNGAGKTTLLKLLGGALQPRGGTIQLGQLDQKKHPLEYRAQSFYCGGDPPPFEWLKVQELLDVYMSLYPAAKAQLLDERLAAFGLQDALQHPVTTLSLGQHKKMNLSLALAAPVTLLLIDEPFNGLDAAAVEYLRQELSDPERLLKQCIVLTSHVDPLVPISRTIHIGGHVEHVG